MEENLTEITPEELASRWRMSVDTLRVWRSIKRGPSYNKRGGKVTYSLADVLEYEKNNKNVIN